MLYVVLALAALALLVAIARSKHNKEGGNSVIVGEGDCASCTPGTTACSRECSMETALRAATDGEESLYFDDEELDVFRGRPSDSYTAAEAELFSEVMLTMLPSEVAQWGRCLALRGIELPDRIKDDYFLLAAEE